MNGISNMFDATENYKLQAIQLHNKISGILNSDAMLPYLGRLNTSINSSELKPILGTYILKEMKGEALPPIIELNTGDGHLNVRLSKDRQFKYYLYDKTIFFNASQHEVGNLNNIRFTRSEPKAFFVAASKNI